ncbi:MAG: 1-(5-phosphoribosyl)-5-[(5-phosphoribosylamino)methylideneamino]imidazole-4-carboxamide isomerase [Thermoplasmata archaeon]
MMVLPAVDIKDGKCVQLVGGKPGTEKVVMDDAVDVAMRWQSEGADMIHVIDLDSALGSGSNEALIEKLVGQLDVPVQVGGGVRTLEKVQRLFDIGVERVIVGTKAIEDRRFLEELSAQYSDGIVVALDSISSEVLVRGWQEKSGKDLLDLAKDYSSLPIFGFLYTNVEIEGKLQGIDPVPIRALLDTTDKPLIVSGGITTLGDLDMLARMGVNSAVVGMAIYTSKINFRDAVRMFR